MKVPVEPSLIELGAAVKTKSAVSSSVTVMVRVVSAPPNPPPLTAKETITVSSTVSASSTPKTVKS